MIPEVESSQKYINIKEIYHLFQDLPLEIAMYDLDGHYKFVNKLYEPDDEIRKQMIGKDDDDYFFLKGIDPESLLKRKEYFQQAVESKKITKFTEKLQIAEDPKPRYYERAFRPIFSNGSQENIWRCTRPSGCGAR